MNTALMTMQSTVQTVTGQERLQPLTAPSSGAYPGDIMTTRVFYPKPLTGNDLKVRLAGVKSNRSAIGTRICLEAGGKKKYREVSGGSFDCLLLEQHFGLAGTTKVDALQIRWSSGLNQRFTDLPANDTWRFTEDEATWRRPYQR